MGSKAVAAIGMASVIHQSAIHTVEAKTATPAGLSPAGLNHSRIAKKAKGPANLANWATEGRFIESGSLELHKAARNGQYVCADSRLVPWPIVRSNGGCVDGGID